jgi:chromosome segregation ATPase
VAQGVWGNVDKAEYDTIYMNHSNQTIANLANCRREEHALVNDINTSQAKLNAHNREYTNHLLLEPKELLKVLVNMNNTITSLQSTVTSLQSTVTSLQSAVSKLTEDNQQLSVSGVGI